ncbi:MAG: transketolase [bacterium (Candidatus Ratteibacteria) CG_4_10_14_3_um_filter_41_18]|uniref:Transketolase n=3 Tax=Candidatus Ratteibacteria TaxID=2979319 RepID=A0A2M7E8Q2_9BACT|nr:MAG: transketolase [bacterium (Candidatus Ratteibacteria) CG01_land_8_20_14_3_00_40_19]PIW33287.1 MAG: transketolase [bacterium (Candidatus Ratteibacteria) CG15_BIG_FIL_POST_REV_8_21_14_020_41_12]PIX77141.1 MAG: transketolase [bacterium (Candidatus Ratteibacteria) CG_4_10_14_3_um_filter_41_18]
MNLKSTRDGYGEALLRLGRENPRVVVLTADLGESTRSHWFKKEFPERFFQMGVAEADMVGTAAGLALSGKIPFMGSFGVFVTGRVWDQLRVSVAYNNANVKIGSTHCGITVGEDGATHQAIEDIALMRVLPGFTVIVPADNIQAIKATIAAAKIYGPVYLRLGRASLPVVTKENAEFNIGKAEILKEGKDLTIIACGVMVCQSSEAASILEKEGISVRLINLHTIKPIDEEAIIKAAKETGAILTAEEHQVMGGMGSAVAEVVMENCPVPMKRIGILDRFGQSGKPEELMREYGLTAENIVKEAKNLLKRKTI